MKSLHPDIQNWQNKVNLLAAENIPFLFIIDYDIRNPLCFALHSLPKEIEYSIDNKQHNSKPINIKAFPPSFSEYKEGFDRIMGYLKQGDSYLVNYTMETPLETNVTLADIYRSSSAAYKLLVDGKFVVFSPETFVRIDTHGKISTYPMKGTIDASIPDAENLILLNAKEAAEHATVVDLLRNDLSKVAKNVQVDKYRFVQKIRTADKTLLQVSSKISGQLPNNWKHHIADILLEMLPAGSVTGAPKKRTLEIINQIEKHKRGYYTGIFGIFDGQTLDSAVMIRYMEQRDGTLYYKSGGGITSKSVAENEYEELKQKIYVPIG